MADLNQLLATIDEMHKRLSKLTYYDLLNVTPEETTENITRAYRLMAREWHVDRFSTVDLGERKSKVQEIFAALNQAHRTLSDPKLREDYDVEMDIGDQGPDIGAILEAESSFRQGKNMLNSASFAGAFEKFKFCVEVQPDEIQYRAHALYCEFALLPKDKEGMVNNKERAEKIFAKLDEYNKTIPEKDWLLVFLGNVALGLGKANSAQSMFNEALIVNPQNHEAKRQIRLVRMRKKNAENSKGFFAKLFGK